MSRALRLVVPIVCLLAFLASSLAALDIVQPLQSAKPLDSVSVVAPSDPGGEVVVLDGAGHEYTRLPTGDLVRFTVAGALGDQHVQLVQGGQVVSEKVLKVDAATDVRDGSGQFTQLFNVLVKTMMGNAPRSGGAGAGSTQWHGTTYRHYVPWILDNAHTSKGMCYFSDATPGLVDLWRETQKSDGMVWSFVSRGEDPHLMTAYAPDGYAVSDGGLVFARQPVENHNEYNYVDCMHQAWKASGDDAWMAKSLDSAIRALDYSVTSPVRYSTKFGLLKRGYTIDSWDFQVDDAYTYRPPLATLIRIDPEQTKFGVFFGDNHGYAHACDLLAEMLDHAGRGAEAAKLRERSAGIRERLDKIAWNGQFFTHRIEEDPAVKRDLGVDEKSQIAMSNAYALNRGIPHAQSKAIIETYLNLKEHLPAGSPGEWYAIYPPFEKGFGKQGDKWQYMNGGVHGHAAGELARGAFENGYETYGADILTRIGKLGNEYGKVMFAYTGATEPPPPAAVFTTISLAQVANMDLYSSSTAVAWMREFDGNDVRGLPVGAQLFADVPFDVTNPAGNGRRSAIGVSALGENLPAEVSVPLGGKKAGAIYLLHASSEAGPSGLAGSVDLQFEDGAHASIYVQSGKHLNNWWYPQLGGRGASSSNRDAGVAWSGPNQYSTSVGLYWAALANPYPDKPIRAIRFAAALDGATYGVVGLTLADRMPYHRPGVPSTGGPDGWAGGLCMAALMEGLAGIQDTATAFGRVRLSPRWLAAGVDSATVTARYPASKGYVAYEYTHTPAEKRIALSLSGSAQEMQLRVLLPQGAEKVVEAQVNGLAVAAKPETIEKSVYATFPVRVSGLTQVGVTYR